jgi:pyrimidine oxygenase
LIFGDTDAEAERLAQRYAEGADMAAILAMLRSWGAPADRLDVLAKAQGPFMTQTTIGSPDTCAEKVLAFIEGCELDGVMLIFPDYVKGLRMFGSEILPKLKAHFA